MERRCDFRGDQSALRFLVVFLMYLDSQVAVKVLHKSVLKSADVDIQTAFFLVKALHFMFPTLDFLWLAEEIQRNLPLEMNFVHEAANRDQACALNTKSNVKVWVF
jgi:aarF domain-containing kinase